MSEQIKYGRPDFLRPGKLYVQRTLSAEYYDFPGMLIAQTFKSGAVFMHMGQILDRTSGKYCGGDKFLGPDGRVYISWPCFETFKESM